MSHPMQPKSSKPAASEAHATQAEHPQAPQENADARTTQGRRQAAADALARAASAIYTARREHEDWLSESLLDWMQAATRVLRDTSAYGVDDEQYEDVGLFDSWIIDQTIAHKDSTHRQNCNARRVALRDILNDDGRLNSPVSQSTADALADRVLGVIRRTDWGDEYHRDICNTSLAALRVCTEYIERSLASREPLDQGDHETFDEMTEYGGPTSRGAIDDDRKLIQ